RCLGYYWPIVLALPSRPPPPAGAAMAYRRAVDGTTYVFDGLRDLLAKATPPRSGDRLAGVAAESAEQMFAARRALADVPLKQFLHAAAIPYEAVENQRLILVS